MTERPSIQDLRGQIDKNGQQALEFETTGETGPVENKPKVWATRNQQNLIRTMIFERYPAEQAEALWNAIDWTKVTQQVFRRTLAELKAVKRLPLATRSDSAAPAQEVSVPEGFMHGTYTVEYPDGDYRVIRFRFQPLDDDFMPGVALIGYQNGPSNIKDYRNFAHVRPSGTLSHWRRWSNPELADVVTAILKATYDEAHEQGVYVTPKGERLTITKSDTCAKCGQALTAPEAKNPYRAAGYGPKCGPEVGLKM